ncbi:MAG: hypothetical protein HY720_01250 [Planctomycetes bacterium]|nr:hypothetical protein [Planctomycetota bacterium]
MSHETARPPIRKDIVYPDSDGEPMSDNEGSAQRMMDTWTGLRAAYRWSGARAYVGMNLFVYPVEGKPWLRNSPDIFVAPGSSREPLRTSFRYWDEEGRVEFAGEVLSRTKRERLESPEVLERVDFYANELGTRELFLYEPLGFRFEDGFRFAFLRAGTDGRYHVVEPGEDGWYRSEVLPYEFRPLDDRVEFRDPGTGEIFLPDSRRAERAEREAERADHEAERADHEAERAEREARARAAAEERLRELEQEIERLRGNPPAAR